jgi:hypothetical protein
LRTGRGSEVGRFASGLQAGRLWSYFRIVSIAVTGAGNSRTEIVSPSGK